MLTVTCHPYTAGLHLEALKSAGEVELKRDGVNTVISVRGNTLSLLRAAAVVRRLRTGATVELSDE